MDDNNKYGCLEMQKALMPLLAKFDHFCVQNDINYSMGGGSMLGTVRHQGFIPWDDDIDLNFDRNNYQKVLKALSESSDFVVSKELWIYRVRLKESTRVNGTIPTIDMCVFDNVPDSSIQRDLKFLGLAFLQGGIKKKLNIKGFPFLYKVCSIMSFYVGKLFPQTTKERWYDLLSQWGNANQTEYVNCYNTYFKYLRLRYKSSLMSKYIRMPFENIEVNAIEEYDYYLKMQYGDYMTLPDDKERVPSHMKVE